jgi:hypothetical protein
MMEYRKPSKQIRNEEFLRNANGYDSNQNPYAEEKIETNKLFLIICEGGNTEPYYLKSFPVPTNSVIIEGACNTKTKLVDYALKLKNKKENIDREVWCVFDFDIKPDEAATQPKDFNNAILKAEANGMKVAWSNDSFELWFLLHYQNLVSCITRKEINSILKETWELSSFKKLSKKPNFSKNIYKLLGGDQSSQQLLAIDRAERLHNLYLQRADYSNHCPCTTVYKLVTELNKYLKK